MESAYRFGRQSGEYFENNGLFSTFDAEIVIAETLAVFDGETFYNLDIIKHVRNTFAHCATPIKFSTPEIADACDALKAPPDLKGKQWTTARSKFIAATYAISVDLIDPARLIPVMPRPLP